MERIKADTEVGQIPGQADTFKVRIESPLCNVLIRQGVEDLRRDMFSLRKINNLYRAAIDRIAEQQDFKVGRLRIFVDAALV